MASTMRQHAQSPEVPLLDAVRPAMAKAALSVPQSPALRAVVGSVLELAGPKKAVADTLGKDRSQIRRQLESGTLDLRDLEALGPEFYVDLAKEILETYGPLATPQARAKARLREARAILDELDQALELIA